MKKKQALPPLFYSGSGYWIRASSRFLPVNKGDLSNLLLLHQMTKGIDSEQGLTVLDTIRTRCMTEQFVDYAGPLAGHRVGLFATTDGRQILVTSEPATVFDGPGKKGSIDFIRRYLEELLQGDDQLEWCLCWLKCAVEALREGSFRPGQMVVLAGPPESGKSFFHFFITELLGGRAASPYKFMVDRTTFNADLAQAESLVIEDEVGHKDIRSRFAFGAMIKQMTVNEFFDVHGKNRQAISLPTFRRLTLSVNEQAQDLLVLPPMDNTPADSIIGKVSLLKCTVAKLSADRTENKARLRREIPAFRRFLADFKIPKRLHNARFGCTAWHHPELLDKLCELSPETTLLEYIGQCDKSLFDGDGSWQGSATELEAKLVGSEPAAARLFQHTSSCGQLLAKLAAKWPERFSQSRSQGKVRWKIKGL